MGRSPNSPSGEALIVAPVATRRRHSWSSLGLQQSQNSLAAAGAGALVQPEVSGPGARWAGDESQGAQINTLEKEAGTAAYEVLGQLGEGSFATCVRIRQLDTGQIFAGKLCPKRELTAGQQRKLSRLGDETKLGLLGVATEIEIHASLMHHNIVQFQEYFFDQVTSKLCMVLEYCAHGTLRRVLQQVPGKVLPQTAVQRWIYMLMDALNYMHSCGIAHRDINPDNLLIDEALALKLGDFGFAARVTTDGRHIDSAAAAEAVGTLNYIAPEVLLRDGLATGGADLCAADVWAVGVVMHEALLGRVPFLLQEDKEPAVEVLHPVDAPAPLCVETVDFIAATLHRTTNCRPTAEQLLDHAFFGGSFCAFPGTKAEIELRTAAETERHLDASSSSVAHQHRAHDTVLALPPSPPREDLAVVSLVATATTKLTEPTQVGRGCELLPALASIPGRRSQWMGVAARTQVTVSHVPEAESTAAGPVQVQQLQTREQPAISIRSPSNRRALAISPARCDSEARAQYEHGVGGDIYRAAVGEALTAGSVGGSIDSRSSMVAAAAAKHQALASCLLQTLGVPMLGMGIEAPHGMESRTSSSTSASVGATCANTNSANTVGLDEEMMSWVLLLQLDPLLDARWIVAAQQWLRDEAAVAVATLSDDDSGSDSDITVGGGGNTMTVAPTTMALSPERDRTALLHFPNTTHARGHGVRTRGGQQDHRDKT